MVEFIVLKHKHTIPLRRFMNVFDVLSERQEFEKSIAVDSKQRQRTV